jgi:hypothetical protein
MPKAIQPTATTYAPEVEARRKDYETIAESFTALAERISAANPDLLRIETGLDDAGPEMDEALTHHFDGLHKSLDWFDPRTIRKFYVEMRLHADQGEFERDQEKYKNRLRRDA